MGLANRGDTIMEIVRSYQFKRFERCKRCGRKLRNNESQLLGFGPGCYKKHIKEQNKRIKCRRLF